MRFLPALLASVALLCSVHAEDITLVVTGTGGADVYSQAVTLGEGDTATLLCATKNPYPELEIQVAGKTIVSPCWRTENNATNMVPFILAGPASFRVKLGGYNSNGNAFVTVGIKRTGTASDAVAIPQEPGSSFDVILESSSDLVNWLAINPGEYSGTEARRFFRTRIVKKTSPEPPAP